MTQIPKTDDSGLATGVSYVNRADRRDYAVRARIVVLVSPVLGLDHVAPASKDRKIPQHAVPA